MYDGCQPCDFPHTGTRLSFKRFDVLRMPIPAKSFLKDRLDKNGSPFPIYFVAGPIRT